MKCTWCKGTGYIWINKMKIIALTVKEQSMGLTEDHIRTVKDGMNFFLETHKNFTVERR